MASAPDIVIQRIRQLSSTRCSYDAARLTFDLSNEPFTSEPFGRRQTKHFFPGLHGLPSA